MSDLVCEHGSLRRKCEICERDERIVELERELEEARKALLWVAVQGKPAPWPNWVVTAVGAARAAAKEAG
jgi:hypothetical protein